MLTADLAAAFARVALANVEREYPRKLDQLISSEAEIRKPKDLHPAFYGSYDWHSAVHMHWLLVRVLRLHPSLQEAAAIETVLAKHLSAERLAAEAAYFRSPGGKTFERPYGWAWLLELQAELIRLEHSAWTSALQPLSAELARRMDDFVSRSPYPIRAGSHSNTAFACILALDYAQSAGDGALERAITEAAKRWYGADRGAPLAYEPSLDDFLSPALVETLLMKKILRAQEFEAWMKQFLPDGVAAIATPPSVADHADAKQSHLDGLCLSRAWCLRRLGHAEFAERHLAAGMPHVAGGDYVGEHWLASFALLALSDGIRAAEN